MFMVGCQLCMIGILYLTTLASGDEPNIVIIGAGPAGIAAASKLFENGFKNITILEAENRIGGRVYTTWFDESWIDLGGQWVHGETNNTSFQLASPLGLLEVPQGNVGLEFIGYTSKGCQVPNSVGNNLADLYYSISDRADQDLIGYNGSVGDYFIRMVDVEVTKYPEINETLKRQFIKLYEGLLMSSEASDNWHEVAKSAFVNSSICPGSNIVNWKDRGYGTILDILMLLSDLDLSLNMCRVHFMTAANSFGNTLQKKYPNPAEELPVLNNTLLNSEVVNINYQSIEGKAVVETSNGNRYTADHVIVTPSLGVLKENYETLFTPQLPELKVKTIKGLSMGSVAKIFLSFEAPWWPDRFGHFGFLWDEDDKQEYENDPNRKWLVDVLGVSMVEHRPRLLSMWMSGASARYMETLSKEQVFNQSIALIDKFLGTSFNITRPTGIIRTKWCSNKHFRGTYSFRSIETEKADVWAVDLAAPLLVDGKPIIMFAGEATHSQYWSTVHGAIDTGFREANRLTSIYKSVPE